MPEGLDIMQVVESVPGSLADRLEGSRWQITLPQSVDVVGSAVAWFLGQEAVEVQRMTKKGLRIFDCRAAVVSWPLSPLTRAPGSTSCCGTARRVSALTTCSVRSPSRPVRPWGSGPSSPASNRVRSATTASSATRWPEPVRAEIWARPAARNEPMRWVVCDTRPQVVVTRFAAHPDPTTFSPDRRVRHTE